MGSSTKKPRTFIRGFASRSLIRLFRLEGDHQVGADGELVGPVVVAERAGDLGPHDVDLASVGPIPPNFRTKHDERSRFPVHAERQFDVIISLDLVDRNRRFEDAGVIFILKPFRPATERQRIGQLEINVLADRVPFSIQCVTLAVHGRVFIDSQVVLENVVEVRRKLMTENQAVGRPIRLGARERRVVVSVGARIDQETEAGRPINVFPLRSGKVGNIVDRRVPLVPTAMEAEIPGPVLRDPLGKQHSGQSRRFSVHHRVGVRVEKVLRRHNRLMTHRRVKMPEFDVRSHRGLNFAVQLRNRQSVQSGGSSASGAVVVVPFQLRTGRVQNVAAIDSGRFRFPAEGAGEEIIGTVKQVDPAADIPVARFRIHRASGGQVKLVHLVIVRAIVVAERSVEFPFRPVRIDRDPLLNPTGDEPLIRLTGIPTGIAHLVRSARIVSATDVHSHAATAGRATAGVTGSGRTTAGRTTGFVAAVTLGRSAGIAFGRRICGRRRRMADRTGRVTDHRGRNRGGLLITSAIGPLGMAHGLVDRIFVRRGLPIIGLLYGALISRLSQRGRRKTDPRNEA